MPPSTTSEEEGRSDRSERRISDIRLTERRISELEAKQVGANRAEADHEKRITRSELVLENMKEKAEQYVSRQEFTPIRMIVYGLAATALTGLLSAILSKVLIQ